MFVKFAGCMGTWRMTYTKLAEVFRLEATRVGTATTC